MFGTDLSNWLGGGTRARELADTRRQWDEVEALWRASPLALRPLSEHVVEAVREGAEQAHRWPATPILVAVAEAVEDLLRAEDIIAIEAEWEVISADASVAVNFRQMLARRRRWAGDFERTWTIVRGRLVAAMRALFNALPASAFESWDQASPSLGVPLVDLVDDLPSLLDRWLLFAYDDDTLERDLFLKLRRLLERNLLVASGFAPSDSVAERHERLVIPSRHKAARSSSELAELYLADTPLADVLDLRVPFHIDANARFEHCHILGGTGHGKTQFMQGLILEDLDRAVSENRSVIVIDSQGDLINKLMRLEVFAPEAPGGLADRLVVVDPADVEHPAALNLFDAHLARLQSYSAVDRERVLNGVVELYEVFFGALLGAELTQKQGVIFRYLARLMLAIPGATIHTLMQLMEDGRPFREHMDRLDGSARYFFQSEFFHPSFAATKKQILRRLWGVLSTPAFERMFAQPKNRLDLFEAMGAGKIVLINTAKDLLKTEGSQLFGRFFIALVAQAALERSTLDEADRNPVFVYVDEAQEYFDERIETILTQARKYRVGLTLAHQTLDQLSPRLRSAIAANTSLKCVGGVSAKDARAMADELHTSAEFIDSMRRRPGHTEFAVWLKHHTPGAIRLAAPLGALERRPQLSEEQLDELIDRNRRRYCGTLEEAVRRDPPPVSEPAARTPPAQPATPSPARLGPPPVPEPGPVTARTPETPAASNPAREETGERERLRPEPPSSYEPGKGGRRHRYLQSLVKELAEQQGFKAVIEAPLAGGGQVDVLLTRGDLAAAVEISVTTPVEQERENLRKALAAGYQQIALVLAKTARTQARYRQVVLEGFSQADQARVSILAPEEIPDFIAALAPAPEPTESIVKGYKVRVTHAQISPNEARVRKEALARILARSLSKP